MAIVTGSAALDEVVRCFPGHRPVIEALARASSEFQSLCDDFAMAATTLRLLEASQGQEARARIEEYRLLVVELAREITASLGGVQAQQ